MTKSTPRRFTLIDAMILVAATAVGLAGIRAFRGFGFERDVPEKWTTLKRVHAVNDWFERSLPCPASWTFAMVALRLRRPRPPRRRLVVQPGFVAVAAAGFVLAHVAASMIIIAAWNGDEGLYFDSVNLLFPGFTGLTVAASWSLMALGGRWRPEASWVDRAGRAMGLFWIVCIPYDLASLLLEFD